MKETDAIDEYILQHIDEESDYLKALYRDTHVKLLRPRMASGHLQGRMLKMFVQMIRPRQVLEIGTYSGYSALCLAEGLEEGATLLTENALQRQLMLIVSMLSSQVVVVSMVTVKYVSHHLKQTLISSMLKQRIQY